MTCSWPRAGLGSGALGLAQDRKVTLKPARRTEWPGSPRTHRIAWPPQPGRTGGLSCTLSPGRCQSLQVKTLPQVPKPRPPQHPPLSHTEPPGKLRWGGAQVISSGTPPHLSRLPKMPPLSHPLQTPCLQNSGLGATCRTASRSHDRGSARRVVTPPHAAPRPAPRLRSSSPSASSLHLPGNRETVSEPPRRRGGGRSRTTRSLQRDKVRDVGT